MQSVAGKSGRLDAERVRAEKPPEKGNRVIYDRGPGSVRGFGLRITAADARSFVINYTVAGRERRYTIGGYPAWTVAAARDEAKRLRQEIDRGHDPLGARVAEREAPTVNELCNRYLAEHASRKRTGAGDEAMIQRFVRPRLGSRKVASIAFADIDRLHREVTKANGPYRANRLIALLSKMFALSVRWELRADNPARGIERNPEEPRERYLSGDELRRLTEALAAHPNQQAANVVRLLLLTGARRGEVLGATWEQFDLEKGVWTKPSSHTKQKKVHRVPLSAPARQLLAEIMEKAGNSPYVFPGRVGDGHLTEIKKSWAALCDAADLRGLRVHDLRHSFASILVSSGLSLAFIGPLLGHTKPGTTARYAHLFDDPLRAATERVGAIVTGGEGAKIEPLRRGR